MNTESPQPPQPVRFQLAIDSLKEDITLLELSYMLIQACEESAAEGKTPETDPAVALIAGRIGFASPADCMSAEGWDALVGICSQGLEARVELKDGSRH